MFVALNSKLTRYILLLCTFSIAPFVCLASGLSGDEELVTDHNSSRSSSPFTSAHSSPVDSEDDEEIDDDRAIGTGQEHPELIHRRREPGPSAVLPRIKVFLLDSHEPLPYPDYLYDSSSFFDPIPCNINPSAWWYGKHSTKSRPKIWRVIQEGTGLALSEMNPPSVGEHWAYFIERPQGTFVITFGRGRLLNENLIIRDFGSEIVRNTHPNPTLLGGEGFEAKFDGPNGHDILGKAVKGSSYCQFEKSLVLYQLPTLCDQLLELSRNGAAQRVVAPATKVSKSISCFNRLRLLFSFVPL